VEDELEAKKHEIAELEEQHKKQMQMEKTKAMNELNSAQQLGASELQNQKEAAALELETLQRELETRFQLEADAAHSKLEASEARYQMALENITELEGKLVEEKEKYEVSLHEAAMVNAQLQGDLDTAKLHVSRVDTEKLALEQKLSLTREGAKKIQTELEILLDDAESTMELLREEVNVCRKTNDEMHASFKMEKAALLEAKANAERVAADANYNYEATAKRLSDVVTAERTAHQRTRNEADQVQLRLRRDLQVAREAAEDYHSKKVVGEMSLKLEKERAGAVRMEMHSALQAVDIMSQERDLAELRCEEVEWSSEQRCNRLVTDKLMSATKAKEDLAKQNVARKFAEDQAQLAAARARQAEDELVDLQSELNNALASTRNLEKERDEAMGLLQSAQEKAEMMEGDQQMLIGYADSVTSLLEYPSPMLTRPKLSVSEFAQ